VWLIVKSGETQSMGYCVARWFSYSALTLLTPGRATLKRRSPISHPGDTHQNTGRVKPHAVVRSDLYSPCNSTSYSTMIFRLTPSWQLCIGLRFIDHYDRIVLLDAGSMIESDSTEALMSTDSHFKRLNDSGILWRSTLWNWYLVLANRSYK
jgi:hypothetical protein